MFNIKDPQSIVNFVMVVALVTFSMLASQEPRLGDYQGLYVYGFFAVAMALLVKDNLPFVDRVRKYLQPYAPQVAKGVQHVIDFGESVLRVDIPDDMEQGLVDDFTNYVTSYEPPETVVQPPTIAVVAKNVPRPVLTVTKPKPK